MTIPEIFNLLNDLGDSSQKVADNLRQQGIKGYRYGDGGPCPITQYLTNKGMSGVSVGVQYLTVDRLTEVVLPPLFNLSCGTSITSNTTT